MKKIKSKRKSKTPAARLYIFIGIFVIACVLFLVPSLLIKYQRILGVSQINIQLPYKVTHPAGVSGSKNHSAGFVQSKVFKNAAEYLRSKNITSAPADYVDLSRFAPPVGDQGTLGSCSAWATGYYLHGWYAISDQYNPVGTQNSLGSFSPMYTYSQIVNGANIGTSFAQNFDIQTNQGIDPRFDYTQGDYNNYTLPTAEEQQTAANYKITGYQDLFNEPPQTNDPAKQTAIETSLTNNTPVVLAFPLYSEFFNATNGNCTVGVPATPNYPSGNHAVMVTGYDSQGAWIVNQWGLNWGCNGYAHLTWDFINGYALEATAVNIDHPASATSVCASQATVCPAPMQAGDLISIRQYGVQNPITYCVDLGPSTFCGAPTPTPITYPHVSGTVFVDSNYNKIFNRKIEHGYDNSLGQATVQVLTFNNLLYLSEPVQNDGTYQINIYSPGTYKVQLQTTAATFPTSANYMITTAKSRKINFGTISISNINFGVAPAISPTPTPTPTPTSVPAPASAISPTGGSVITNLLKFLH